MLSKNNQLFKAYKKINKVLSQNLLLVLLVSVTLLGTSITIAAHATHNKHDSNSTPVPGTTAQTLEVSDRSTQPAIANSQTQANTNTSPTPNSTSSASTPNSAKNSRNTSNAPTSTYKPPVCTKTTIPYKTTYYLATWKGAGEVSTTGGTDGYSETCTADSTGYIPYKVPLNPVNKTIYVGDGGGSLSMTTHPQSEPYETVYARALPACDEFQRVTNYDATAKQWCLDHVVGGILHYYGY